MTGRSSTSTRPDAMLLVFASDHYDAADYMRDYEEFRALVNR